MRILEVLHAFADAFSAENGSIILVVPIMDVIASMRLHASGFVIMVVVVIMIMMIMALIRGRYLNQRPLLHNRSQLRVMLMTMMPK